MKDIYKDLKLKSTESKPKKIERKSVTDISKWLPNVNALNNIEGCTMADDSQYDFPAGTKDNGVRLYDLENKKDVTFRTKALKELGEKAEREEKLVKNYIDKEIQSLNDSIASNNNAQPNSQSPTNA